MRCCVVVFMGTVSPIQDLLIPFIGNYSSRKGRSFPYVWSIEQARIDIGMPSTIHGGFQGTAQAFQASLASEPWLILLSVVAVYIVLGMLYESFIHPLTILSTLPSAGVGAIVALLLFKVDLSVIAMIGIILLIGIVIKNAIMMIDFALVAEREQGKAPVEAIFQACMHSTSKSPRLFIGLTIFLTQVKMVVYYCTADKNT